MLSIEFLLIVFVALICLDVLTKYDWDSVTDSRRNIIRCVLHIPVTIVLLAWNLYWVHILIDEIFRGTWPQSVLMFMYLKCVIFPVLLIAGAHSGIIASIQVVQYLRHVRQTKT